jgi:putative copper resistance protein D
MNLDPLTGVRAIHFAATVMVAGTVFFRHVIAGPVLRSEPEAPAFAHRRSRLDVLAAVALAVAVVSGALWLILESAAISGQSLAEVYSENVVWTVLAGTRFGHVLALRGGFAILLGLWLLPALRDSSSRTGLIAVPLAGCFLGALAWVGHAGAGSGGTADLHLASDTLHLLAASAWIGGLVPLALCLASARRAGDPAGSRLAAGVTARFSTLGLVSVGTLLATGTLNTWFLAGSVQSLVGTDYGRLLMVKVSLFVVMTVFATINRVVLTARLPDASAIRQLQINCGVEFALGLAVVVAASVLGTLPPPLHIHH